MRTLLSIVILTLLFLVGSKKTVLGYSQQDYNREEKEFCSVFIDDEKVKKIINPYLHKVKTTDSPAVLAGLILGYCDRTTLPGLPDIYSRLLTNEYGLGIESKYSYSQFCFTTSSLFKDLTANDIRRLMILLARPIMRSLGDAHTPPENRIQGLDIPEEGTGMIVWISMFRQGEKSNDWEDLIHVFELLYMDLKWYPEMSKNHDIIKYKTKEYKDFFKFLLLGDKNGALKILRESVSKGYIFTMLSGCGVTFHDSQKYFNEEK